MEKIKLTDDDDYERAEDNLDDIEDRIEVQYGRPYFKLTKDEQTEVILGAFFSKNGKPQTNYRNSAIALRDGLQFRREGKQQKITSFFSKNKQGLQGKKRFVVRDEKGHFKRWIKD